MKKTIISTFCVISAVIFNLTNTFAAGGVFLGKTRIVYPATATQSSISVNNSSNSDVFLIQSWISDKEGKKTHDFIVTPPLFVIKPGKESTLRMELASTPTWPKDRETLYYFNVKAIPSATEGTKSNSLQIATQTVIKMFVRPDNLPGNTGDAAKSLRCSQLGTSIKLKNPSSYYISMVNLHIGASKHPSIMVAPKSTVDIPVSSNKGTLSFQTINDFGTVTPVQQCLFS